MYSLVKRQLKYTQAGAYTTYEKKFKEMVVDLHATIYGARAWPDYDVLSEELHMYAESTERMKVIQKDYNSGKVSAFAANSTMQ